MHRHRHDVVGDLAAAVLVEIVADPRPVREQVLDGDVVRDQRQVLAEERARGGPELERAVLDQAHHRERRQSLQPACDRKLRVDLVRDLVPAVREAVRLRDDDLVAAIDPDDTREAGFRGDRIQVVLRHHGR